MKMLIAAILLVSSSAIASAVDDTINIQVLSYCQNNKVVAEVDNQVVLKQDCDALQAKCVDYVSTRGIFTKYVARCEQPAGQQ